MCLLGLYKIRDERFRWFIDQLIDPIHQIPEVRSMTMEYFTDEDLSSFTQAELIEIIRQYRKTIDEQNGIIRNSQGEEILQDEKLVEDEEVVL